MSSESILEIQALIYGYAERIDSGDYEGIGQLFKYGRIVVEDSGDGIEGALNITEMYKNSTRLYEDGTPKSKHLITNLIIELADDDKSAQARSYYTVLQRTNELALQPIITGRYQDSFERTNQENDRWHFKKRKILVDQLGDLSKHLLFELPE